MSTPAPERPPLEELAERDGRSIVEQLATYALHLEERIRHSEDEARKSAVSLIARLP